MHISSEIIVTIVVAIIGSGGFWSFLQYYREKKSGLNAMVLGLGFSQLNEECNRYIDKGYISVDELNSLTKYLYEPYKALGGDGIAEKLYNKVIQLPNEPLKTEI